MKIRERLNCQKMTVEQMRKVRDRINERLLQMAQNQRAPYISGTLFIKKKMKINLSQSDFENLNITQDKINRKSFADNKLNYKISLSTTDINYVNYLIEKGRIRQANKILLNLKSTVKIINNQIASSENYLLNKKEK